MQSAGLYDEFPTIQRKRDRCLSRSFETRTRTETRLVFEHDVIGLRVFGFAGLKFKVPAGPGSHHRGIVLAVVVRSFLHLPEHNDLFHFALSNLVSKSLRLAACSTIGPRF